MAVCRRVTEKLLLFRDGELPEDEIQYVREHLHLCPPCLDLFNSYEELVDILQRLKPVKVPEGLLERMKRKMAGELDEGPCGE